MLKNMPISKGGEITPPENYDVLIATVDGDNCSIEIGFLTNSEVLNVWYDHLNIEAPKQDPYVWHQGGATEPIKEGFNSYKVGWQDGINFNSSINDSLNPLFKLAWSQDSSQLDSAFILTSNCFLGQGVSGITLPRDGNLWAILEGGSTPAQQAFIWHKDGSIEQLEYPRQYFQVKCGDVIVFKTGDPRIYPYGIKLGWGYAD
ncbi:MAG TPA: hypothetical protein VHT34_09470 [Clostridia bacterium]|nr:hypothetical protein [Clostridia bacterium]